MFKLTALAFVLGLGLSPALASPVASSSVVSGNAGISAPAKGTKSKGASCSKGDECKSGSCIKNPKGFAGKVCA